MHAALIYISEYVETKRMMTENRYRNEDLLVRLRVVFGCVDRIQGQDTGLESLDLMRSIRNLQIQQWQNWLYNEIPNQDEVPVRSNTSPNVISQGPNLIMFTPTSSTECSSTRCHRKTE